MAREILIDPVTRIEGHAKITLKLDDTGAVTDALFHVTQFRGFEKFVDGRPMAEMPAIMARICGICPVSHLIAGSKACDALLAVDIPPTAKLLRRVLNLAQIVQSHALSFFHLASPDFVLGYDSDPATRNFFGLAASNQALARDGIRLRSFGQTVIETLGGKKIHPAWTVPGGVSEPLNVERRDRILSMIPEALDIALRTVELFKGLDEKWPDEVAACGNFESMFMGMVTPDGRIEHYDGDLRMKAPDGKTVFTHPNQRYEEVIAEATEPFSFMKFPYYKAMGYPAGMYRVGPLARLMVCEQTGTELADKELADFRKRKIPNSSFHNHMARLIEIVHGIEAIRNLLNDQAILDLRVRARARANRLEGIGVAEAPRGTLIHHYKINDDGQMVWANLVIATGHNNLAMNAGIKQAAQKFVKADKLQEGMLNRVEAVIRAFDPCLSCATHAVGEMPMLVELVSPEGQLLDTISR